MENRGSSTWGSQTDIACKKSNLVWIFEQMLHCWQIYRIVNTSRIFKRQLLNIGQFLHEGAQKVPSQMPQQCWCKKAGQQTPYTVQQGFPHHLINRTRCLAAGSQVWVQVSTGWLCRSWDTTFFFPSLCLQFVNQNLGFYPYVTVVSFFLALLPTWIIHGVWPCMNYSPENNSLYHVSDRKIQSRI